MHPYFQRATHKYIQRHRTTPRSPLVILTVAIHTASNRMATVAVAGILAAAKYHGYHVAEDRPHGGHAGDDDEQVGFGNAPVKTTHVIVCMERVLIGAKGSSWGA